MDHHCPFVGNCIGRGNQKLFWNFLLHASLCSGHVGLSFLLNEGLEFFIVAAFTLSISVSTFFLLGIHTDMILNNTTTIEA
jgi:hypothetical protein